MDAKRKLGLIFVFMTAPALALAQEGGGSGGSGGHGGESGGGCGDVLGDLVHILRDPTTGQPILQKRVIEEKGQYVDGYCPIPVNTRGEEIGLVAGTCDPLDVTAVVEVDYFGRLSGGRTKERNNRMHFDEVISSIKDPAVGSVTVDDTGRLMLGYDCEPGGCSTYRTIDSPMENLALYTRVMKYGHLQTDPMEVDIFAHGDPDSGTQYHPALTKEDYRKFDGRLKHLLPNGAEADPGGCWSSGVFDVRCGQGEFLDGDDFTRAAAYLAGAASKTGVITRDLVQYMNRILKIARNTEISTAAVATLPVLIRDCGEAANASVFPAAVGGAACTIMSAAPGLRAPADERFVDFGGVSYIRSDWYQRSLGLLQRFDRSTWKEVRAVSLIKWLEFVNGPRVKDEPVSGIDGFVDATSDGLRSIEFVHNYAIPEDLWPNLAR